MIIKIRAIGEWSYTQISKLYMFFMALYLWNVLTLKPLKYFVSTKETKGLYSIWNHHKCLIWLYLHHLNTYVMCLRLIDIFIFFSVGIIFMCQNLMSTDVGLWRIKTVPALKELNTYVSWSIVMKGSVIWKKTKMFLPHPLIKLRDRDVACSVSDLQGLNFESCVWRAVSSHSSHHPQEVLLVQFSLYVHKSGLSSFHIFIVMNIIWIQLKFGNTWNLQCTACAFILFWSDRRYQFH